MIPDTELELYTPQDAARVCACCAATVKRLADEIRLPVIRTVGGVRLFSRQQVERIQQERERRTRESCR
jgi:excisionase family DNA binding protein